ALERLAVGRYAVVGGVVDAEVGWEMCGEPAAELLAERLVLDCELEVHGARAETSRRAPPVSRPRAPCAAGAVAPGLRFSLRHGGWPLDDGVDVLAAERPRDLLPPLAGLAHDEDLARGLCGDRVGLICFDREQNRDPVEVQPPDLVLRGLPHRKISPCRGRRAPARRRQPRLHDVQKAYRGSDACGDGLLQTPSAERASPMTVGVQISSSCR